MFSFQLLIAAAALVCVSARHIILEDESRYYVLPIEDLDLEPEVPASNGHGMTLTKSHIPGAGDRLAAAAHVNVFHNNNHNLDANAFAARTMPVAPQIPNFNTYGGGADYMYKNKIGAEASIAHTPLFQKTDYSAGGKLNLFHGRDSSLDFNAGLSKSVSPFLPKSSWEPNMGFTFKKWF